jgi:hypothetical protein
MPQAQVQWVLTLESYRADTPYFGWIWDGSKRMI